MSTASSRRASGWRCGRRVAPHPRLGRRQRRHRRPPKGTTHVVLDTPAGLHGKRLDAVMRIADRILIPLQPSLFDIQATHAFVQVLRQHRRAGEVRLGLVGMRCVSTRVANEQLHHYLAMLPVPVVGWLRDTQNYSAVGGARPHAVGRGPQPGRARPGAVVAAGGLGQPDEALTRIWPNCRRWWGRNWDAATGCWWTRRASTSSPRPPVTTNGSTPTRHAPPPAPSAPRWRMAS